jgi:hypothetical protein
LGEELEVREVLRKSLDGVRQGAAENGGASMSPETWDLIVEMCMMDGDPQEERA